MEMLRIKSILQVGREIANMSMMCSWLDPHIRETALKLDEAGVNKQLVFFSGCRKVGCWVFCVRVSSCVITDSVYHEEDSEK